MHLCCLAWTPLARPCRWASSVFSNAEPRSQSLPPGFGTTFRSNLTFDPPAITAYVFASSPVTSRMDSECLLPSAAMAYLPPAATSFELHCHLTLASGFSVTASKTTVDPSAASWLLGFLAKAETGLVQKRLDAEGGGVWCDEEVVVRDHCHSL